MSYLAKAREPISSLSHCIGAVVFAAATLLLVGKTLFDDWSPKILVGVIVLWRVVGGALFGERDLPFFQWLGEADPAVA